MLHALQHFCDILISKQCRGWRSIWEHLFVPLIWGLASILSCEVESMLLTIWAWHRQPLRNFLVYSYISCCHTAFIGDWRLLYIFHYSFRLGRKLKLLNQALWEVGHLIFKWLEWLQLPIRWGMNVQLDNSDW